MIGLTKPLQPAQSWLRQHGWRDVILPLVLYSLVMLMITWPLAANISTHYAGPESADSVEYARLGWWANYALQHGLNPFYQSLMGYPQGFFSTTQWSQPLIYWPIALLDYIFNPIASFNLWLLLELILSGWAAYWLCREIVGASPHATGTALFGGLVFMAFPAMQGHLGAGHINPLANYAMPVVALCLYRLIEGKGGIRIAIVGALALLILALGNFTFPVYVLLPLLLFGGLYVLLFQRKRLSRQLVWQLAVMFGLGAALILPFYLPLLAEVTAPNRPAYLDKGGSTDFSTDLLSFIAPSPFTPWGKQFAPPFSSTVLGTNVVEGTAYLGVVVLALAIVALWQRRRTAALWAIIAAGCMLFSLGPLLKLNGSLLTYSLGDFRSNIVLPWALFQRLPLFDVTRTPGRFNMTTGLALGVLATLGLDSLLVRIERRRIQIALLLGLTALMLFEYQLQFPFSITLIALPSYFAELPTRASVSTVFDIPWDDLLAQKQGLEEQIVHQQPLTAGYISRSTTVDPARLTVLSNAALNSDFHNDSDTLLDKDQVRAILKQNHVDVLVYHWPTLDLSTVENWAVQSFFLPAFRDPYIAVFELPDPAGQPDTSAFTFSDTGWWWRNPVNPVNPTDTPWLENSASLYVYAPTVQDRHWNLTLTPLLQSRRLQLSVDGKLERSWLVSPPTQQLDFWLRLEPGFHDLKFSLPDGCTPIPVTPVCLLAEGASPVRNAQNCSLTKVSDQNLCVGLAVNHIQNQDAGILALQTRNIRLHDDSNGAEILLQGFRAPASVTVAASAASANANLPLTVETNWQVTRKLPGDYHLFVHVLDSQGKLIAQYDTVPGAGTFATALWSPNQFWTESATVTLPAGTPPGTYSIYTGWYQYPTLTRLQVDSSLPHASDGLLFLQDVTLR